ncbi:DUF4192 domain-containing protein [Saccharopolyspora sp. ID03-671]|uniref:DUF4192 domain-containing protein n=1 Tax=Saccharopolyspora sp. ID03-671 TaxID=3073066 RepID=UPI00324B9574
MNERINVPMNSVDDLLAGLPHMLGFYPRYSLALIALDHVRDDQHQLGSTMRVSLPEPDQYADFLAYVTGVVQQRLQADAVLLFLITDTDAKPVDGLPHESLVNGLLDALAATGSPVVSAVWTPDIHHGAEWVSYLDPSLRGTVADPQASLLGAELTALGHVLFSSREDLAALIEPDEATAARWAIALDGLGINDPEPHAVADRIDTINDAITEISQGRDLDDDELVEILYWISDTRVRDALLPTAIGEHAAAAHQLWLTLVRKAPAPELADAAVLLTVSAFVRSEGPLASVAVDRALEVDPEHPLRERCARPSTAECRLRRRRACSSRNHPHPRRTRRPGCRSVNRRAAAGPPPSHTPALDQIHSTR